ncbi:MAG: hypothetical protein V1707_01380 [bacterium]
MEKLTTALRNLKDINLEITEEKGGLKLRYHGATIYAVFDPPNFYRLSVEAKITDLEWQVPSEYRLPKDGLSLLPSIFLEYPVTKPSDGTYLRIIFLVMDNELKSIKKILDSLLSFHTWISKLPEILQSAHISICAASMGFIR